MLKSTITLQNGQAINIECETAQELVQVISMYEKGTSLTVRPAFPKEQIVTTENDKTEGRLHWGKAWSKEDILLIAQKLNEYGSSYKAIKKVVNYLLKNSHQKHGKTATVIQINRIKRFLFEGDEALDLSRNAKSILKQADFKPKATKNKSILKEIYSKNDIIAMANIILGNIEMEEGLPALVQEYIKTHGDTKDRTHDTLKTMTSGIKHYLKNNDDSRISGRVREVLSEANIHPNKDKGVITPLNTDANNPYAENKSSEPVRSYLPNFEEA